MSEYCCSNCVPVLLQTYREKQELELMVTKQKAEISRLTFAQLLTPPSTEAVATGQGPDSLVEELLRKYQVPSQPSHKPQPIRKTLPRRTISKQDIAATVKRSAKAPSATDLISGSSSDRKLKHSSSLMSPLKESDLKSAPRPVQVPKLKVSVPPLRELLAPNEVQESVRSSKPAITLEELRKSGGEQGYAKPTSSIGERFLPLYEKNGSLLTASGASIRLGELLSSSSNSPSPLLHVFPSASAALQSSASAVLRVNCLNSVYT